MTLLKSVIIIIIINKLLPAKVNQIAKRLPGHCIAALHAASRPPATYAACAINSNISNSTGVGHSQLINQDTFIQSHVASWKWRCAKQRSH